MNKLKPENIFCFILIGLIIIFLIILLINPTIKERFFSKKHFSDTKSPNFIGNYEDRLRLVYNLNPSEYYTLVQKYKALNKQYKTGLSWESESIVKNNKLNSLMSILYNRACPPQLIGSMPGYTFYGPADFNLNDKNK